MEDNTAEFISQTLSEPLRKELQKEFKRFCKTMGINLDKDDQIDVCIFWEEWLAKILYVEREHNLLKA